MVGSILMLLAFLLALLASVGWPAPARPHFGWLALAFFILAQLVGPLGFR